MLPQQQNWYIQRSYLNKWCSWHPLIVRGSVYCNFEEITVAVNSHLDIISHNRYISEVQSCINLIHHIQWCWFVVVKSKHLLRINRHFSMPHNRPWAFTQIWRIALPEQVSSRSFLHLTSLKYFSSFSLEVGHWKSTNMFSSVVSVRSTNNAMRCAFLCRC